MEINSSTTISSKLIDYCWNCSTFSAFMQLLFVFKYTNINTKTSCNSEFSTYINTYHNRLYTTIYEIHIDGIHLITRKECNYIITLFYLYFYKYELKGLYQISMRNLHNSNNDWFQSVSDSEWLDIIANKCK